MILPLPFVTCTLTFTVRHPFKLILGGIVCRKEFVGRKQLARSVLHFVESPKLQQFAFVQPSLFLPIGYIDIRIRNVRRSEGSNSICSSSVAFVPVMPCENTTGGGAVPEGHADESSGTEEWWGRFVRSAALVQLFVRWCVPSERSLAAAREQSINQSEGRKERR